jgi:hypothetical protein
MRIGSQERAKISAIDEYRIFFRKIVIPRNSRVSPLHVTVGFAMRRRGTLDSKKPPEGHESQLPGRRRSGGPRYNPFGAAGLGNEPPRFWVMPSSS